MSVNLSIILLLGALCAFMGQVFVKQMRSFGLATCLFTLWALVLAFTSSGAAALVRPAVILAGGALFPQVHAIARSRPYRNVLGVSGTLLWCAAALHTWTTIQIDGLTNLDVIAGFLLLSCLGIVSIGFAETAGGLLRIGQGKLWLAMALVMTILVTLAPWAGATSGAPIALSNGESFFGAHVPITLLYRDMNLTAPIEIQTLATGQAFGLGALRTVLLYLALFNIAILATVALTGEELLRRVLYGVTMLTACVAAAIPLLSLFAFMQETTAPGAIFELAVERLGFGSGKAAVDLGLGTVEALKMHPLGLTPSSALLAGLAASLFVGVGQTREPTIFEDADPGLRWSMYATLTLGISLVWAQWATRSMGAGFGMDRTPWITLLAALLFVVGTAFTARMGKSSSRLTAMGHWLAFATLIIGIIGPGEGWTA